MKLPHQLGSRLSLPDFLRAVAANFRKVESEVNRIDDDIASLVAGTLTPGTANYVFVTNGAGTATAWAQIVNANVSAAAAIAYSKLNLTGSIVEADLAFSIATQAELDVVTNALAAHIADTTDAHAGSAITNTPAGNISATTVQGAINELDTEKLSTTDAASTYVELAGDTMTGNLTIDRNGAATTGRVTVDVDGGQQAGYRFSEDGIPIWEIYKRTASDALRINNEVLASPAVTIDVTTNVADFNETPTKDGSTIWHAGNDGAGSTLDADLLDGQEGSYYATASSLSDHLADTTDAHDASAISILDAANDFTATDVEGALAELQSDHEADAADLANHIADTTDAHDASAISVADAGGYYTSTDVESALQEVYVATTTNTIAAKYRGAWDAAVQYATGDIVIFDGNSIIATSTPTLGDTPVGNALAGVWDYSTWGGGSWGGQNGWTFLVAAGADGAPGATGVDDVARQDALYAQDLAQDAIKEATTLDDATNRKLDFELEQKAEYNHIHDDRYIRKIRRSLGMAPVPSAAADYVMAMSSTAGFTAAPYFATLTGSYSGTGMMKLNGMDLMAGGKNWNVRAFVNVAAGDTRNMYMSMIGGNTSGTYSLTSTAAVGTQGVYAEGTEDGAISFPISVGGSGHEIYSYVGVWVPRQALVDSGKECFGAYFGFSAAVVSVGWFAELGFEIQPY